MSGGCPNVTITVRGMTIVVGWRDRLQEVESAAICAAAATFQGPGMTQSNGTIKATEIRVRED